MLRNYYIVRNATTLFHHTLVAMRGKIFYGKLFCGARLRLLSRQKQIVRENKMMIIEGRQKKVECDTKYAGGIELQAHHQISSYNVPWCYSNQCCYDYGD